MNTKIRHGCYMFALITALLAALGLPCWAVEPAETVVKLIGDDEDPVNRQSDQLGYSVALEGDVAVVGAPYDDAFCLPDILGLPGTDCGAVHVFIRGADGVWRRDIKLFAPDGDRNARDRFGSSVAIEGDVIVVGAPRDDLEPITKTDTGAVYVFRRPAGQRSWQTNEGIKLTASDAEAGDELGLSVAISGGKVLAGAPGDDYYYNANIGAAYVFYRIAGAWTEVKIRAYDAESGDWFGTAVAYSGDSAAIGAPNVTSPLCAATYDDYGNPGLGCGAVYVYTGSDPQSWPLPRKLSSPDIRDLGSFGRSIAMDGSNMIIGENDRASIYSRDTDGHWQYITSFTPDDEEHVSLFGSSVAISGFRAVVGAPYFTRYDVGEEIELEELNIGAAYVYAWDVRTGWKQHAQLLASDREAGDHFGYSVAIDGDIAVIGATDFEDETCAVLGVPLTTCNYGAAYVFTLVVKDVDQDTVDDTIDNCVFLLNPSSSFNPDQADMDGDGWGGCLRREY